MTMTATQDLRLQPKTRWHEPRQAIALSREGLSPVMSLPSENIGIHVDGDGNLWADAGSGRNGIDWHRLPEYQRHGYSVIARDVVGAEVRPALLLEPVSKESLLDYIAEVCQQAGLQKLGPSGQPRCAKPVSKDWTLTSLVAYLDRERVVTTVRGGRLLLAWPDGSGPYTIDLRHALDVLGGLLTAHVSGNPVRCRAVDDCAAVADTILFLDTPACATHTAVAFEPSVDMTVVPWWEVMWRGNTPAFLPTPAGLRVLGLADPPENARVRIYWSTKKRT